NLIFIFYLFALLPLSLLSIDSPKNPKLPDEPVLNSPADSRDSRGEKEKKAMSLSLRLCDGREVRGEWSFGKEELSFSHFKEGIAYSKKLKLSEIASLRILSWEMKKIRKQKDGVSYELLPKRVTLTVKTGERFLRDSLANTEFLNVIIVNENGSAKFYSYWMDLMYENGKWFSSLSAIKSLEREDCHPDVIREIVFN
ncbi:MAG: hypothetical protein K8R21_02365, partial [Leptospira sp.]|nr:hypothetical protein [Leptospira sp.]